MTTQFIRRGFTPSVSFSNVRTLIILLAMLIVIGSIYVGQSTQATLNGQRVQDLQEKLDRLNRQNAQLQYDIATLNSPVKIAERARALGLHPAAPSQMVFLTVKNYPTSAKLTPPVAAVPSTQGGASPLDQVLAWLGLTPSSNTAQARSQ